MISESQPEIRPNDPSVEARSAAWIVEQLELEAGEPAERSRIRRSIEDAVAAWPGAGDERWWRWMLEAGESLRLRCRVLDCTLDQLKEIAREGGRVVVRLPSTGQWIAISETRGRKFVVFEGGEDSHRRVVSWRRLKSMLGSPGRKDIVRVVAVEPRLSGGLTAGEVPQEMTPLDRVWALLRPESGDIWIVLLFALVAGILAMATPLAIEALVSTVTFGRLLQPIVVLSLMLLAFLSFQAAIRGLQTYVVEIIQRRLFARVAADLAFRLPRAEFEALKGQSGRELVNRFFDVVTVQKVSAQLLLDGISIVLNTLIGMLILGFYHPWLLGFDVVLLSMIAFAIFVLGRGAIATSIKESKMKYRMASWLEDLAGCTLAFRYDGAAQFAMERADQMTHEYLNARRRHFRVLMRQIIFALGLQAVASTVLLGLGGWLVITEDLTLGQLVAAELIVTMIVTSFAKLGKHMESFYDLVASVDKLGALFDLPVERQDGLLTGPVDRPADVAVTNISYISPDGRPLLDGISLKIGSGEKVALVGRSGSGKSALLDLFFGLTDPEYGHIDISGADPRELRPDVLRRYVALVREVEVFEGSILENVHLERPEVSVSDVRLALEKVSVLDELVALPAGLDTPLNTTGFPLTPSQLRKLMIARGIAGNPRLLMIDGMLDALSDADAAAIMTTLADASQPWTMLLVTGRSALSALTTRTVELRPPATLHHTPSATRQETTHAH